MLLPSFFDSLIAVFISQCVTCFGAGLQPYNQRCAAVRLEELLLHLHGGLCYPRSRFCLEDGPPSVAIRASSGLERFLN